jgi:hypothetical protein
MKEILVAWSIFGRGNVDMPPDEEQLTHYLEFQDVLRKLLPDSLGFQKFAIRNSEVVLECSSGDFLIDACSGGLSALIDLAWQVYMYGTKERSNFTVIIDEVENHLHPTLRRRILSDLLRAFPSTRFIVATHAPLVVNSVRDSAVYVLRYNINKQIESQQLDIANKARTAAQILDEVLGVSSTIPIWAQDVLTEIVNEFADTELNRENFSAIRERLQQIGLGDFMPEAVEKLLERASD